MGISEWVGREDTREEQLSGPRTFIKSTSMPVVSVSMSFPAVFFLFFPFFHKPIEKWSNSQESVKKVYESLFCRDISERCLRGLTQNANGSFHAKTWAQASKSNFDSFPRIRFVTLSAVLDDIFGYQEAKLLKKIASLVYTPSNVAHASNSMFAFIYYIK